MQLGLTTALFKMFTSTLTDALNERPNLATLGLVDFEFLPHYNRWTDEFKLDVMKYAETTGVTIFACDDGDGLIVNEHGIHPVGNVKMIRGGCMF